MLLKLARSLLTDIAVQCKKKHVTVCPEFTDTGLCPRGSRCPLRHMTKKRKLHVALTPAKTEHDPVGYGHISQSYSLNLIFFKF